MVEHLGPVHECNVSLAINRSSRIFTTDYVQADLIVKLMMNIEPFTHLSDIDRDAGIGT